MPMMQPAQPPPGPAKDGNEVVAQMRAYLQNLKNQVEFNGAVINNLRNGNNQLEQKILGMDRVIESIHMTKARLADQAMAQA